ncbi:hypothetical protein GP486_002339 [Trichoglossum hirsutum]|uniref:Fungal STAND N-terminal Goodbye domain-containing protein n=1 Tax=Trichoglossum hirsutum TaxID=265104 RepID=A0A9P8LEZ6_9PEZI|nr:hypothetical protein GP486_002339 [Trichoglossum hirsutum]
MDSSRPTTSEVVINQQNPFARAISSFLSELQRDEDIKSPFYKEVLAGTSILLVEGGSSQQIQRFADSLSAFVLALESQQKSKSKTRWVAGKLRPLLEGLSQYTTALDTVIQAGPAAAIVIYGGARLVLQAGTPQLAQSFYESFDTILDIMAEIGRLLRFYELSSAAYESSSDMQELLVESYKSVIIFWQKAAKVLSRRGLMNLPKAQHTLVNYW